MGQTKHAVAPDEIEKLPLGQLVQLDALLAEKFPAVQLTQTIDLW